MIERATHIVAYTRGPSVAPGAERQSIAALGHVFPLVEVRGTEHLNLNTCPVADYVWSLDGPAGVPDVARNLPFYGALIALEA